MLFGASFYLDFDVSGNDYRLLVCVIELLLVE